MEIHENFLKSTDEQERSEEKHPHRETKRKMKEVVVLGLNGACREDVLNTDDGIDQVVRTIIVMVVVMSAETLRGDAAKKAKRRIENVLEIVKIDDILAEQFNMDVVRLGVIYGCENAVGNDATVIGKRVIAAIFDNLFDRNDLGELL